MVRIRLMRVGKKKQPSYRVVVADGRSPRDGRIIEAIGHYHPRHEPSRVVIDTERADYWISVGAQPSATVNKLLGIVRSGTGMPAETGTEPAPKATPAAAAIKATPAASVEDTEPVAESEPSQSAEEPATPAGDGPEPDPS